MIRGSTSRQTKRKGFTKRSAGSGSLVPVSKAKAEMNLARKVLQLSKQLKVIKPEMKYADISLNMLNISPVAGNVMLMSSISQATAVNARVGENVHVRHVEFHGEVSFAASIAVVTTDNPSYRVYVVQDTQQVPSTNPAVSDLVDQPGVPVYQLFNVTEQKRFRVLYDSGPQMLYLGNPVAGVSNSNISMLSRYHLHLKKKVSIPVEFNAAGAGNIQKNGIYFMICTDAAALGAACLDWLGSSRIGYTDS